MSDYLVLIQKISINHSAVSNSQCSFHGLQIPNSVHGFSGKWFRGSSQLNPDACITGQTSFATKNKEKTGFCYKISYISGKNSLSSCKNDPLNCELLSPMKNLLNKNIDSPFFFSWSACEPFLPGAGVKHYLSENFHRRNVLDYDLIPQITFRQEKIK